MSDIELAAGLLNDFNDAKVKELLDLHPWMKTKKFRLLTKLTEIEEYIDVCIDRKLVGLDLETTGLNTRLDSEGNPISKIVGVCLSNDPDEGIYIPVDHHGYDHNVPISTAIKYLSKLVYNCVCVFHNFKYDGEILRNYGIIIDDDSMYEDTVLMAHIENSSRKTNGLKYLSDNLLNRPQLEINGLGVQGNTKNMVAFTMVPPEKAVYYAGADAMNTLALYHEFKKRIDSIDPDKKKGPWSIYKIEKRCLFVTMEMERNRVKVNKEYLYELAETLETKMSGLIKSIHEIAGRPFDINSPAQLGTILFDELKVPYPMKEKSKNGQYMTGEEVLQKVRGKAPIVDMILSFRGHGKVYNTYIKNLLKNIDDQDEVKFQLNQTRADTGRYSASGGKGLTIDGYCGVNCQNLPKYDPDDPDSVDVRKAFKARPGYKIVSIDYSGEELRIAANLSREPKWIQEFNHGIGDLHTITGQIITGKKEISKKERGIAKALNFLTLYGGGAGGFSAQAKIPYETAKKMLLNFFKEYKGLKSWIDREHRICRKRGYSKTVFGRRRPLTEYYSSSDKGIQAKGDRLSINSAVQGCLQGDERILTNIGYIPILELYKMSDNEVSKLKVWTGLSWETFQVLNRGEAEFARLELKNGMVLNCDTRHEVLVSGDNGYEFKHYNDLKEGDMICTSIPEEKKFGDYPLSITFNKNKDLITIDRPSQWIMISYLIGYIISSSKKEIDLYVDDSFTFKFSVKKGQDLSESIKSNLKSIGLDVISAEKKVTESSRESLRIHYNEIVIPNKDLLNLFRILDVEDLCYNPDHVPEMFFRGTLEMRKSFIRGFCNSYTYGIYKKVNKVVNQFNVKYELIHNKRSVLRDVQIIGWTIGEASFIEEVKDNFRFFWQNTNWLMTNFCVYKATPYGSERMLYNRRTHVSVLVPNFKYKEIYDVLEKAGCIDNPKDKIDSILLKRIYKLKNISVNTALCLLKKYDCENPGLYFQFPLSKKTKLNKKEDTYTLSVNSPLHRFDSGGFISKNTAADIIKIVLYRVYKWIKEYGYEEDIKILLPIHDEIVFEVKDDKLDYLIPELCEVMKIKDLIKVIGWEIPLEVDAEYGDTLSVENDFWKEFKKKSKEGYKDHKETLSIDNKNEGKGMDPESSEEAIFNNEGTYSDSINLSKNYDTGENNKSISSSDINNYYKDISVMSLLSGKDETDSSIREAKRILDNFNPQNKKESMSNFHIKERIDREGYFSYPIDISMINAKKVKFILEILSSVNEDLFVGPRYKLCLLNNEGEVYYKSKGTIPIDAFLVLCLLFNI